jgi:hypothetical protein
LEKGSKTCPVCGADATEWKESEGALLMGRWAKVSGKGLHMGRVNSERRFLLAARAGADSVLGPPDVDGTMACWGPDINLARIASWLRRLEAEEAQLDLFALAAA